MFSYRSIVVLCAARVAGFPALLAGAPAGALLAVLLAVLVPRSACAQATSPPAEAPSAAPSASFDEPPPLEGGSADPPPAQTAPITERAPMESAPAGPPPCPETLAPPPAVDSPASEDPDAVFRAFAVFAKSERDRRIVGTVAGVVAGVTTIALGALIAEPTGTDADVWYVIGGITIGTSLIGLLLPSPAEGLARSYRVQKAGHSASEARSLEIKWNDYALASRRRRVAGGAVSLAMSAFFVGGGIAIATGAGDFTQGDRDFWGSFLIATGATVAVSGAANLFVKSSAERSLEAYRAVRPESVALRPLLSAGPGGVLAGARGTF